MAAGDITADLAEASKYVGASFEIGVLNGKNYF